MKKTITTLLLSLFLFGCNQTQTETTDFIDLNTTNHSKVEESNINKTNFRIEFVESSSFLKNDTTIFTLKPHDYASVSLKPKVPGIWLIYSKNNYIAFTKDLDTVIVEIVEKDSITGMYLDTTILTYKTIQKNKNSP